MKSTVAQDALKAHQEIDRSGFNGKQKRNWEQKEKELKQAALKEISDNEKIDEAANQPQQPHAGTDGSGTPGEDDQTGGTGEETPGTEKPEEKKETVIEAKTTETKEKKLEVKITKATYGRGTNTIDIADKLNALPNGGNKRKVTNKLAGQDPLPKKVKTLELEYSVNGVTRTLSMMENEIIELDLSVPEVKAEETKKEETATA